MPTCEKPLGRMLILSLFLLGQTAICAETNDEGTRLKELVIQAMTTKSLEHKSESLESVPGDLAAQRTEQIAQQLVRLSNKKVQIRIVKGLSNPASLASGEILIPARGMNRFTEGEIHFIIAHELAHIELQHLKAVIKLAAQDCPMYEGDAPRFILQVGECIRKNLEEPTELGPVLRRLKWRHEHESDLWATRFLSRHKLPNDYRTLFEKLKNVEHSGLSETHPPADQRLHTIEQLLTK